MAVVTWTQLRTIVVAEISAVSDVGKVITRQQLPTDWTSTLKVFKTTIDGRDQIRGWVVLPNVPFRVSVLDALRSYQDTYSFTIFGFQSGRDEDTDYQGTLDRATEVAEGLDARQAFGLTGGDSVFFAGPANIRAHEWRRFTSIGCWYTELDYSVVVNRADITYD